jgi:cell division protein FtsB
MICDKMETVNINEKNDRIETFEDLLHILRMHPDWLATLRSLILTNDLIDLPRKFDEFIKKDFKPLQAKVDHIEKDVTVLKQDVTILKQDVTVLKQDVTILKQDVETLKKDVEILKQDVAVLKKDVAVLKDDVAALKGSDFERTIREKAPAYLGRLIKKCRGISIEDLAHTLDDALDAEKITDTEYEDAILIDVVVKGLFKTDKRPVILAVEVSLTVDLRDVERAYNRANVIAKTFDMETIGVAIGKSITHGAQIRAEELNVLVV